MLAVTPRIFPLCSTNSHPVVQTVGLAVLTRSAEPVAQYLVARELEVHFPLPGRSRETRPVRVVHHRDDLISSSRRTAVGNILPEHSEGFMPAANNPPSSETGTSGRVLRPAGVATHEPLEPWVRPLCVAPPWGPGLFRFSPLGLVLRCQRARMPLNNRDLSC